MSLIHCCLFGTIEYLAIWFGVLIKTVEMETITNGGFKTEAQHGI
jgi:hypothetical protein